MLRRFWRHFWTRKSATGVLIAIFLLVAICAVIQVGEIWGKAWSNVASIGVIVLTAVTATMAFFGIPANPKQEARRKIQSAINSYVILDSLGEKSVGSDQKNRVINRMRELAPHALYTQEEITDYLDSPDVGERFAALASIQWQWSKVKVKPTVRSFFGQIRLRSRALLLSIRQFFLNKPACALASQGTSERSVTTTPTGIEFYTHPAYIDTNFTLAKKKRELPAPPNHPDKGYFPALLNILCASWSGFENYHAMVAMWSMLDCLEPEQLKELCDKVIDKDIPNRNREWKTFTDFLKEKCG